MFGFILGGFWGPVVLVFIVSYIPSTSLKMDGRRGKNLSQFPTAFGAYLQWFVAKFLYYFKSISTILAYIFIKRHLSPPEKIISFWSILTRN